MLGLKFIHVSKMGPRYKPLYPSSIYWMSIVSSVKIIVNSWVYWLYILPQVATQM